MRGSRTIHQAHTSRGGSRQAELNPTSTLNRDVDGRGRDGNGQRPRRKAGREDRQHVVAWRQVRHVRSAGVVERERLGKRRDAVRRRSHRRLRNRRGCCRIEHVQPQVRVALKFEIAALLGLLHFHHSNILAKPGPRCAQLVGPRIEIGQGVGSPRVGERPPRFADASLLAGCRCNYCIGDRFVRSGIADSSADRARGKNDVVVSPALHVDPSPVGPEWTGRDELILTIAQPVDSIRAVGFRLRPPSRRHGRHHGDRTEHHRRRRPTRSSDDARQR